MFTGMFTGLYRQTVTDVEHVKMIEVDSKSRSRLEIFSNLAKIQESYRWYLFEMPRHPAPSREFGGRVGRSVHGSPPGLARRVPKVPAIIVRCPLLGSDRRLPPSGRVFGPSGVFRYSCGALQHT